MSVDKIIDKKKRNLKYITMGVFGLLVFVILVRALSVKANGDVTMDYTGPEYDSVSLPKSEGKIEQFKKEEQEARDKQYALGGGKQEAVNVNFEKLYKDKAVDETPISEPKKDNETVENQVVKTSNKTKPKKVQNNDEQGYVEANTYDEYIAKKQAKHNSQKETVKNEPEVLTAVQPEKNKNPFGTQAVFKGTTVTGVAKKDMYKCVVHSDQKVANGGALIIRAVEDMEISGKKVPKNSLLYGIAQYSNNRVKVVITRIKSTGTDIAATCSVYDNDYIEGIFFKNTVDKAVDESSDDVGDAVGDKVGGVVGTGVKVINEVGKNVKQAVKDRKLNVQEGYIVYIKEIKK